MVHRIRKQVLEFHLGNQDEMFRMQQKAKAYYYDRILPVLEKVFDQLSEEDQFIQLDRLEIELGNIGWDKDAHDFRDEYLQKRLEEKIRAAIQKRIADLDGENDGKQKEGMRKSSRLHAGEQWLYYMRNGYLPWNVESVTEDWLEKVLEALATDHLLVTELRNAIQSDQNVSTRIAGAHTQKFLQHLMEVLASRAAGDLYETVEELVRVGWKDESSSTTINNKPYGQPAMGIWNALILGAAQGKQKEGIILDIIIKESKIKSRMQEAIAEGKVPHLKTLIEKEGKELSMSRSDPGYESDNRSEFLQKAEVPPLPDEIGLIKQETDSGSEKSRSDPGISEEGLFAAHAGLVLLHPFLKNFFIRTGILQEGRFADEKSREKAVWLLHFIATGRETGEEYELVIPKILCNHPLARPLEMEMLPDETSKSEAEAMIEAAIGQWSILKNTSIAGLRESFLQRPGKVYKKNGDIHIAVEGRAVDVLLDYLPWNLSMLKLPWIDSFLFIEWR